MLEMNSVQQIFEFNENKLHSIFINEDFSFLEKFSPLKLRERILALLGKCNFIDKRGEN